jgi:hypothetical protein
MSRQPNIESSKEEEEEEEDNNNNNVDDWFPSPPHDHNNDDDHDEQSSSSTSDKSSSTSDKSSAKSPSLSDEISPLDVDESSLNRYKDHVLGKHSTLNTPSTYQSDVELLYMLQKTNTPMSMYDEIQNWARKSYAINQSVFTRTHLSRTKMLQLIEKNLMPRVVIRNPPPFFFHLHSVVSQFRPLIFHKRYILC